MSTLAVIGHGLTPEGKGWGSYIDSCETVVRMWDCNWQSLIDYGERYDFGYFELSPKQWNWYIQYNVRKPTRGWIAGILKTFAWELPKEPRCELISTGNWVELGRKLGGVGTTGKLKLTRGCVAAAWGVGQLVAGDRLVLVGFDNVYAMATLSPEAGFSQTYRDAKSTRPFKYYPGTHKTKFHNHDYVAEGRILQNLADQKGVELKHAQEIW